MASAGPVLAAAAILLGVVLFIEVGDQADSNKDAIHRLDRIEHPKPGDFRRGLRRAMRRCLMDKDCIKLLRTALISDKRPPSKALRHRLARAARASARREQAAPRSGGRRSGTPSTGGQGGSGDGGGRGGSGGGGGGGGTGGSSPGTPPGSPPSGGGSNPPPSEPRPPIDIHTPGPSICTPLVGLNC